MFLLSEQLPDSFDDLIGAKLARIKRLTAWTTEKRKHCEEMRAMLVMHGYVSFRANGGSYHLQRIGQSCQYDVPLKRRGHLKPFAGKRIRLTCTATGHHDRGYMVGAIESRSRTISRLRQHG